MLCYGAATSRMRGGNLDPMTQGTSPFERMIAAGRREGVVLTAILLATAALHARVLRAPFFSDDYLFLEQVRGRDLASALVSPDPIGNFLRPVSRALWFWLVSRISGESPLVFHLLDLALFLGIVALVFQLANRMAGRAAAAFAAAFVGLHYAADVPLLWASGSQDLLAVTAALAAILWQVAGRRAWAAAALGVGLLSKEGVFVVPLIAVLANTRAGESWRAAARRALPLFLVTGLWAAFWLLTVRSRPAAATVMDANLSALPAALWHLVQVVAGFEWAEGAGSGPAIGPASIALAALAAMLVTASGNERCVPHAAGETRPSPTLALDDTTIRLGTFWALLGALPVAAVASIWSAYFYLFSLCGAGIALGAASRYWPAWGRAGAILVLVLGSAYARELPGFSTGRAPWASQSHLNRFYVERAMETSARFVGELRNARPALPPRSTVFFAEVPPSLGFQTADGPIVRRAYRDSSLRSYYLTEFSREKLGRGPVFFFAVDGDTLRDRTDAPSTLPSVAYSMILAEKPDAAQLALELAIGRTPEDQALRYWLAWVQWANGDNEGARRSLARAGTVPQAGPAPELLWPDRARTHADSTRIVAELLGARARASLVPETHARLAALCLALPEQKQLGVIEAFAFRCLTPRNPDAWRKWASAQLAERRYEGALRSLERYVELGGETAGRDLEVQVVMTSLRRVLRGGEAPGPG